MASSGAEKVLLGAPDDGVTRVVFSPDSNNLLVSSWDSVRVAICRHCRVKRRANVLFCFCVCRGHAAPRLATRALVRLKIEPFAPIFPRSFDSPTTRRRRSTDDCSIDVCSLQTVRLYDTNNAGAATRFTYKHKAAVLDCCFLNDNTVFSGGLDRAVKMCVGFHVCRR